MSAARRSTPRSRIRPPNSDRSQCYSIGKRSSLKGTGFRRFGLSPKQDSPASRYTIPAGWWLKTFPEVARLADLYLVDFPLIVNPDDLAEVVQAFARQRDAIKGVFDDPPTQSVSYEVKNAINNMTKE